MKNNYLEKKSPPNLTSYKIVLIQITRVWSQNVPI